MTARTALITVDGIEKPLPSGDTLQDAGGNAIGGGLSNIVEDITPQLGAALDAQGFDINNAGVIFMTEQASAEVDVAGKGQLWIKTATPNELWFTNDAGTDFQVGTLAGTETLTNKTIDGDNNTISNLAIGSEVTGASTDLSDTSALTYNADTDISGNGWVVDEDNMASNLATKVPTQQSVKAYVDTEVASALSSEMTYKGAYNAATNSPDLDTSPSGVKKGDTYTVTAAGTFFTTAVEVGDVLIAEIDTATVEADWTIVNKNIDAASTTVAGIVELATTAEAETGTDTTRAVTPDALHDMTTLSGAAWFLDEDTMSSNSAVKTASQQSIKAYADTKRRIETYTHTFFLDGQNQLTAANVMSIPVKYAGYIVATSISASGARTAGTLDAQPHKNGTGLTPTGLDLQLAASPTTTDYATVAYGTASYDVAAGDTIGFIVDTTTFTPLANTITVSITVELT